MSPASRPRLPPSARPPVSSHTNLLRQLPGADGVPNALLGPVLALAHRLETEMDRALAIVGLTARGFGALTAIAREGPASQRLLALRLGLESSTTSELLQRLERRGLVRRLRSGMGLARLRQQEAPHGAKNGCADAGPVSGDAGAAQRLPGTGGRRGRPGVPVVLTRRGRAALARAELIAAGVEDDWADRLGAVAGSPIRPARAYGLRRWLTESLGALDSTAAI